MANKTEIDYVVKVYREESLFMEFYVGYSNGKHRTYQIYTVPMTVKNFMRDATEVAEDRNGKIVSVSYSNN